MNVEKELLVAASRKETKGSVPHLRASYQALYIGECMTERIGRLIFVSRFGSGSAFASYTFFGIVVSLVTYDRTLLQIVLSGRKRLKYSDILVERLALAHATNFPDSVSPHFKLQTG
jgi:hypothetical protein